MTLRSDIKDDRISAEIRDGLVEITVKDGCGGDEPHRIALKDASSEPTVRRVGPG